MSDKVQVVIYYDDIDGNVYDHYYDSFRLFDDFYLTIYDGIEEFAAIERLKPSDKYPGYFESSREVVTFVCEFDANKLIQNFSSLSAADIIRLIAEVST
jgi:hypothetical protein